MIGLLALTATLPALGGLGAESGLLFRARIDCSTRSEDGKGRLSFFFPEPDVVLEARSDDAEEQRQKYAILRLSTDEDGRTWLAWDSVSEVPAKRQTLQIKAGIPAPPPPPVYYPLIFINGPFEMLAPNSSDGTRWSYSQTIISAHGPAHSVSGKCKLTEFLESGA